jgi:hypothetical protein
LIPAGRSEGVDEQARRYQRTLTPAADSGELFAVRVRYKAPGDSQSQLVERPVHESSGHFRGGSQDLRFATAVAAFGLLLKGQGEPGLDFAQVAEWADGARGRDESGLRRELVELVQKAGRLTPAVANLVDQSTFMDNLPLFSRSLRSCGPRPAGVVGVAKLELVVTFGADGKVENVRMDSAPRGAELWSKCAVQQAKAWRILAPGRRQQAVVPIVLGP